MRLNCVLLKNCYISARELWSVSGGGLGGFLWGGLGGGLSGAECCIRYTHVYSVFRHTHWERCGGSFFWIQIQGRVACRNNRSACPQKFNGFGWFPEIYLGLSLFIWLMSICWYLLNIWDYSLGTLFLATWIHLIFAEAFAFAARCQRWISEKFN